MYGDTSQFKIANALIQDDTGEERDDWEGEPVSEDWREKVLLNASPQSVQEEFITNTEEMVEAKRNRTNHQSSQQL